MITKRQKTTAIGNSHNSEVSSVPRSYQQDSSAEAQDCLISVSVFEMIFVSSVVLQLVGFALVVSGQIQCGTFKIRTGFSYGGQVSERGRFPWLGALFDTNDQTFFCGSSLISQRHVLTAAHCIQSKGEKVPKTAVEVMIFFGRHNLSAKYERGSVAADASEIIVHPDWKPAATEYDADVAIIKFVDELPVRSNIVPVCLWTEPERFDFSEGIVAGW